MAEFARPWALLLLLAIPAYLWFAWRRAGAGIRFAGAGEDVPESMRARWLARAPELLRALALAALIVALAGPYTNATVLERRTEGISIMLAVDVSSSMLAEDFRPRNRLEVAKRVLLRFITARPEDRIGLVAFAGEALTQVPLTGDHEVLGRAVEGLAAGRLEDGTAMGDGLGTAVARLRRTPPGSRVVVLLSDGDNNRGRVDPRIAAEAAASLGVRVFTVGVGSDGVARVPLGRGPSGLRYGAVRVTLDEALLREMAAITGGSYFRATDAAALERIGERLDRLVRAPTTTRRRGERRDRSLGWIVLGTILLLGEWLLLGTRWGRVP